MFPESQFLSVTACTLGLLNDSPSPQGLYINNFALLCLIWNKNCFLTSAQLFFLSLSSHVPHSHLASHLGICHLKLLGKVWQISIVQIPHANYIFDSELCFKIPSTLGLKKKRRQIHKITFLLVLWQANLKDRFHNPSHLSAILFLKCSYLGLLLDHTWPLLYWCLSQTI